MPENCHVLPKGTPKPPPTEPSQFKSISALTDVWHGADVFVVGTGTSLKGFDFKRLDNQITIALNGAIGYMEPSYAIFHDGVAALHVRGIPFAEYPYPDGTVVVTIPDNAAVMVKNPTLSADRIFTFVNRGPDSNSGELWVDHTVATAGIQLAAVLGAQRVYLLGIDCYRCACGNYFWQDFDPTRIIIDPWQDDEASDRREHRPSDMVREFDRLAAEFERLKALGQHVPQVINLSSKSRVRAFPKADLEAVMSWT